MDTRLKLSISLFFSFLGINAQVPISIVTEQVSEFANQREPLSCVEQFAGNTNIATPSGNQSMNPVYLCFGDSLLIDHLDDQNLSGDPQPFTTPGIGYAFYKCPPIISGSDLINILTDTCILDMPPPANGLWVTIGTDPNGDGTWINTGLLQDFFNNGNPVEIWFAPITLDNWATLGFESSGGGNPAGPCVNVNINDAFSVVYLNEIVTGEVNYTLGLLNASFTVTGGLPEYNGSNYTITITQNGNPGVTGTVTSGPATDGSTVSFSVPSTGTYTVTINDGTGCNQNFEVYFPTMGMSINCTDSSPGGTACFDVMVANFTNITSFQYTITFDPAVLSFNNITNINLPNFNGASYYGGLGHITFSWTTNSIFTGTTVPDNTAIYQLCFNVIGDDGASSPIDINGSVTPIEVVNVNGILMGLASTDCIYLVGCTSPTFSGTMDLTPISLCSNESAFATYYGGLVFDGDDILMFVLHTDAGVPAGNIAVNFTPIFNFIPGMVLGQTYYISAVVGNALWPSIDFNDPCISISDGTPIEFFGPPSPTIMGNGTICSGQSATLTATGGTAYQWSNGLGNTATVTTPPLNSTTTYTVTVTNGNCTDTDQVTVNVGNIIANAGSNQSICSGQSATIFASGGTSYQWSNGLGNSATVTTPPLNSTTTYTVTVTNGNCTATDQVTVNVGNIIANAGSNQSICSGQSASLTATGGTSYQWSNGLGSTATVTTPPLNSTTTYTVTVTNGNCTATDQVTVNVGNIIANAGSNQSICSGQTASLTATGGTAYQWSNGMGNTPTVSTPPLNSTVTYTVTVTSGNCTSTDQVTVNVLAITANAGSDQSICSGQSATLTATGGNYYIWSSGLGNTATVTTPPLSNSTSYVVTVTNAQGCTDTDAITVTVNPIPIAQLSPYTESCSEIPLTLTASGGATYIWSGPGGITGTGNPFTINDPDPGYYIVTATTNGCSDTAMTLVSLIPFVPVQVIGDTVLCSGESTILTAVGQGTFTWDGGVWTGPQLVLSNLTSDATHTVSLEASSGCSGTAAVHIEVNPRPNASISGQPAICLGTADTLTGSANGGSFYIWNDGTLSPVIIVSPLADTTFRLIVNNQYDCPDTVYFPVSVYLPPVAFAGPDQLVCHPEAALEASDQAGAVGYWTQLTGSDIDIEDVGDPNTSVSGLSGGTYSLQWTLLSAICDATDSDTVSIVYDDRIPLAEDDFSVVLEGQSAMIQVLENDSLSHLGGNYIFDLYQSGSEGTWTWDNNSTLLFEPNDSWNSEIATAFYRLCNAACIDLCDTAMVTVRLSIPDEDGELTYVITADGNGKNDVLFFDFIPPGSEVHIYNRWGSLLYHSTDYLNDWRGLGTDGHLLPQGTYYFVLRVNIPDGDVYWGSILLLR